MCWRDRDPVDLPLGKEVLVGTICFFTILWSRWPGTGSHHFCHSLPPSSPRVPLPRVPLRNFPAQSTQPAGPSKAVPALPHRPGGPSQHWKPFQVSCSGKQPNSAVHPRRSQPALFVSWLYMNITFHCLVSNSSKPMCHIFWWRGSLAPVGHIRLKCKSYDSFLNEYSSVSPIHSRIIYRVAEVVWGRWQFEMRCAILHTSSVYIFHPMSWWHVSPQVNTWSRQVCVAQN